MKKLTQKIIEEVFDNIKPSIYSQLPHVRIILYSKGMVELGLEMAIKKTLKKIKGGNSK